jgi:hypothetical protein
VDDPSSQSRVAGVVELLDERPVDLEDVHRVPAQVAERGVASAEIIDGDAHTERSQAP